jgi:hypothetical protein
LSFESNLAEREMAKGVTPRLPRLPVENRKSALSGTSSEVVQMPSFGFREVERLMGKMVAGKT